MALVTKTIGTAARDYATFTAWEADIDNAGAGYGAGDDALGNAYNDSAFGEAFTMDGGGTIGLNSVHLTSASGQEHDGTAGSGVRNVGGFTWNISTPAGFNNNYRVSWIELNYNGASGRIRTNGSTAGNRPQIDHMLIHDMTSLSGATEMLDAGVRDAVIHNNILYDYHRNGSSNYNMIEYDGDSVDGACYNNTVFKGRNDGSGEIRGITVNTNNVNAKMKNNISMDMATSGTATTKDFNFPGANPDSTNNMSSDDTADDAGGAGHQINKLSANQFVSTVNGAEDLHLISGSDAIDNGTDLGNTPTDVNIDIDGRDRDALGDIWDIGADEFIITDGMALSGGGRLTSPAYVIGHLPLNGTPDDIINGIDGTWVGDEAYAENPFGSVVADFLGTNDYINLPIGPAVCFADCDFSIALWFQADANTGTMYDFRDADNDGIVIDIDGASQVSFRFNTVDSTSGALGLDVPHFVVATKIDNGIQSLYIDGEFIDSDDSSAQTLSVSTSPRLGINSFDLNNDYNGRIWGVRFYAIALTYDEVKKLFRDFR